ncbi:MAG TPA: hypothetical protein VH877_19300 [Polyangia bacterium]|nr:hypothetical protein [Polyangia bacterium]
MGTQSRRDERTLARFSFVLVFAVLALVACSRDGGGSDLGTDALRTYDPGCGAVDFCVVECRGNFQTCFPQCATPFPGGSDTTVANAYYSCASQAGQGSCRSICQSPDGGFNSACVACIQGTCSNASCSGGVCSTQATACYR